MNMKLLLLVAVVAVVVMAVMASVASAARGGESRICRLRICGGVCAFTPARSSWLRSSLTYVPLAARCRAARVT
jgi:hypothetical protein